jgi:YD repeat-containing protein
MYTKNSNFLKSIFTNRKKKIFCLLLFFLSHTYVSWSQIFDTKGAIAPPAVTSEFMKNIHNSVNYQSGAANFSIHLFSLKVDNGFEIPVDISYHGNGVKDYQSSGEVGIGWSLSLNYRVARTIYNRPDEYFAKPASAQEIYDSIQGNSKYPMDRYLTKFTWGLPTNGGMTLSPGQVMMDGEYDIFDYSTPTSSGSFVIEDVANKIIRPAENLLTKFDFVTDADGIRSFKIQEPNGNNVIAGYDENRGGYLSEFTYTYPGNKSSYAWPVVKITTPSNKNVQFTYVLKNVPTNRLSNERAISISEVWTAGGNYPSTANINDINDGTSGASDTYLTDSVISQFGKIKIYRNTIDQSIDSIALFDFNGNLIKKAIFNKSSSLDYCFLDSLQICGNGPAQIEKYNFEYYSRDVSRLTPDIWDNLRTPSGDEPPSGEKAYPRELSSETYWDHYDFFPYIISYPVSNIIGSGADRSPRETPDYFSLKKVILPTGGYYSYTYESNYFINTQGEEKKGPGIRVSSSTAFDPVSNKTMTDYYKYGNNRDGNGHIPVQITSDLYGLDQVILYQDAGYSYPYFNPGRLRQFSNTVMADNDPFFVRYNVVSYPLVIDSTVNGSTWYYYKNNNQGVWATTTKFRPGFFYTYDLSVKPYLEKMEIYDKNSQLKQVENYDYGLLSQPPLTGVKVKPYAIFSSGYFDPSYYTVYTYNDASYPNGVSIPVNSIYDYAIYNINLGLQVLSGKTITEYSNSQAISTTTTYGYNSYGQLIKETTQRSNSAEELQTNYTYANDLTGLNATDGITSDVIKMQQENIVDVWIEKIQSKNSNNNGVITNSLIRSEFETIYGSTNQIGKHYFINLPTAQNNNFNPVNSSNGKINIDSKYNKSLSEILKTDAHNNTVSIKDAKGNLISYVWDYDNLYPIGEIVNADDQSIAYTSFEADGSGNWNNYTGTITTVAGSPFTPTGNKYYNLTTSATLSKTVISGKTYIISYWSKNGLYSITGGSGTSVTGRTFNGWTYYEHKITASSATLTISGTGPIDEVRLYPYGAQMTTYTYEPLVGMTSQCDPNNRITYYDYDPFGRLMLIKDQDGNILKKYCYNYAGQPGQCNVYLSDAIDADYDSQNCGSESPVPYHVSVPQGMFTSYVDLATANQLAQQYAQNQANQYGTCQIATLSLYGDDEVGTDFSVTLHNVSTGQDYSYTLYAHNSDTMGDVPEGSYDITITPLSSTGWYNYSVGCGYYDNGPGGSSITFYGVPLSSSCNSISID